MFDSSGQILKNVWKKHIVVFMSPIDITNIKNTCVQAKAFFKNQHCWNDMKFVSSMKLAAFKGHQDLIEMFFSKIHTNNKKLSISDELILERIGPTTLERIFFRAIAGKIFLTLKKFKFEFWKVFEKLFIF